MKLYYIPGVCSLASHMLLNEMGIEYQLEKVNSKTHLTQTGKNYYEVNPKGYVPALELDTGEIITENIAVLYFLAEQDPRQKLLPKSSLGRARVLEWLGYLNAELHEAYVVFFRDPLTDLEKEQALLKINRLLAYINQKIEGLDYLVEDSFGPVDAYLFVMTEGSRYIGHDLSPYPNIVNFRERMLERDSLKLALEQEGVH